MFGEWGSTGVIGRAPIGDLGHGPGRAEEVASSTASLGTFGKQTAMVSRDNREVGVCSMHSLGWNDAASKGTPHEPQTSRGGRLADVPGDAPGRPRPGALQDRWYQLCFGPNQRRCRECESPISLSALVPTLALAGCALRNARRRARPQPGARPGHTAR
jgi:hypothetical protein